MSKWDKLIRRIRNLSKDIRFDKGVGKLRIWNGEAGCITCGETIESAVTNAMDAKKVWLEAALEDGVKIHEPDSLEDYSGQFKLRIPKSLHRSLAEHSQREEISMNQYCVYLLSKNDAVYSK